MNAIPLQFPHYDTLPQRPQSQGSGALDSAALLKGRREVLISHGGCIYRLRHTRNDKLILTK